MTDIRELQLVRPFFNLQSILQSLPLYLQQLVGNFELGHNGQHIIQSLYEGNALGTCDGSLRGKNNGAQAYILADKYTDKGKIVGSSFTPQSTVITSLTTEL